MWRIEDGLRISIECISIIFYWSCYNANFSSMLLLGPVRFVDIYKTFCWILTGWAFADSVLHRLAPLWVGARGLEFTWDYILQGLEANANLVLFISWINMIFLFVHFLTIMIYLGQSLDMFSTILISFKFEQDCFSLFCILTLPVLISSGVEYIPCSTRIFDVAPEEQT